MADRGDLVVVEQWTELAVTRINEGVGHVQ
jgi:hypothetical protein